MPVIEISLKDLEKLLGVSLNNYDLEELFSYVKAEIDEWSDDKLKLEMKDTNRPDLWSVEGIARELKGILNIEKGIPKYKIEKGNYEVIVDREVLKIRPYIACAVVKSVNLREEGLSSLIQLQDKVMYTFGRKRRKVAIGTHNFDLIKFPVYYKAVKPREVKFVPLYETREMYLDEILKETEKGKEFAWILEGLDKYPILIDAKNEVLSFPPIINSNTIGRLTPETRNIFIDVTGTDFDSVLTALNVIVTALAERGGKIETVKIIYPDKIIETPILEIKSLEVNIDYLKRLSGLDLSEKEIIELLERKRFNVEKKDEKLVVKWLNYRNDIFSAQDILEELVIAYGYNKIEPRIAKIYTIGRELEIKRFIDLLREIMIGVGALEIYSPVLSEKRLFEIFGFKTLEIENPVSEKYNVLRSSIVPQILEFFVYNKKAPLPQEVFEIGEVVIPNEKIEEKYYLAWGLTDYSVTFTDAKRRLEALFKALGLKYELEHGKKPFLIEGRTGRIIVEGKEIGYVGEVHPEILEELDLENPVVVFEIDVNKLFEIYKRKKLK